jgi:hypothetical protein
MEAGETGEMGGAGGGAELERLTSRLNEIARELDGEPEEERAAELVKEASELATEAGHEVERALRAASEAREG